MFAESPNSRTIWAIAKVKTEKLMINPVITPNGLFFPWEAEDDRTIGKTGNTQGDRTVTIPDKRENRINIAIIISFYINYMAADMFFILVMY